MTANLRESLSAMIDNAADELEMRRVLSHLEESPELRDTWRRYQITRFAMNRNLGSSPQVDISDRIAASIAEEVIEEVAPRSSDSVVSRIFKPVASLAVAASVAVMVVFGALEINQQGLPGSETGLAEINSLSDVAPVAELLSDEERAAEQRLLELMGQHARMRETGIMPPGEFVDFEVRQKR